MSTDCLNPRDDVESPRRSYPKGDRQKGRILDAALRLLVEDGIGTLTIRRIAARAQISPTGLLRHFASVEAIQAALVDRSLADIDAWALAEGIDRETPRGLILLAARNATSVGYVALFVALTAGAADSRHPGHALLQAHYASVGSTVARAVRIGRSVTSSPGRLHPDPLQLVAGWDGLQLQSLYASGIEVAEHLAHRFGEVDMAASLSDLGRDESLWVDRFESSSPADDERGYARGRERRTAILRKALDLFGRNGYGNVSIQGIGEALGMSKSSILNHFPSKEHLLTGVLDLWQSQAIVFQPDAFESPADTLRFLADAARDSTASPELISAYAVLSGEAAAVNHPAHGYFCERFRWSRTTVLHLLLSAQTLGILAPGRDPYVEAVWFIALWDGLQIQWLYAPHEIDIGDQLHRYLDGLLVPAQGS